MYFRDVTFEYPPSLTPRSYAARLQLLHQFCSNDLVLNLDHPIVDPG
jgi:hypothetical protein